jgi:hypothetical protein
MFEEGVKTLGKKMWHYGKNQQGTMALIVMVFLIVFLVIGMISIDIGLAIAEKSKITMAADAAAIAGAYRFEGNPNKTPQEIEALVREEAERFFYINYGLDAQNEEENAQKASHERFLVDVVVGLEEKSVSIQAVRRVDNFFARIFGIFTTDVKGQSYAQAKLEPVAAYGKVIPFGVPFASLEGEDGLWLSGGGIHMDIFDQGGEATHKWMIGPGNWGFIEPPNQSMEDAFLNGMQLTLEDEVETTVDSQPGNHMEYLTALLGRELVAPIVDFESGNKNTGKIEDAPVMGFLAIVITKIEAQGSNVEISVSIKHRIATGDFKTNKDAPHTGLVGVVLVR